ncbi:uncharacterized protein EV422DRAFT_204159 [Fimicolochytrium jonesii]|uniref:uncharacterized protein n=1 Tax=Fimicolochytrium jonesii TaxID=1396493 RepID=UPI0022FE957B|nr:uncharacterized protein EV422DRAFT_204159 [Fimicolochytrium jonesii]KAI8818056.1 hypothetical protein EV422DRAFT_204159 [Fimicolochytrium jonesii]
MHTTMTSKAAKVSVHRRCTLLDLLHEHEPWGTTDSDPKRPLEILASCLATFISWMRDRQPIAVCIQTDTAVGWKLTVCAQTTDNVEHPVSLDDAIQRLAQLEYPQAGHLAATSKEAAELTRRLLDLMRSAGTLFSVHIPELKQNKCRTHFRCTRRSLDPKDWMANEDKRNASVEWLRCRPEECERCPVLERLKTMPAVVNTNDALEAAHEARCVGIGGKTTTTIGRDLEMICTLRWAVVSFLKLMDVPPCARFMAGIGSIARSTYVGEHERVELGTIGTMLDAHAEHLDENAIITLLTYERRRLDEMPAMHTGCPAQDVDNNTPVTLAVHQHPEIVAWSALCGFDARGERQPTIVVSQSPCVMCEIWCDAEGVRLVNAPSSDLGHPVNHTWMFPSHPHANLSRTMRRITQEVEHSIRQHAYFDTKTAYSRYTDADNNFEDELTGKHNTMAGFNSIIQRTRPDP